MFCAFGVKYVIEKVFKWRFTSSFFVFFSDEKNVNPPFVIVSGMLSVIKVSVNCSLIQLLLANRNKVTNNKKIELIIIIICMIMMLVV